MARNKPAIDGPRPDLQAEFLERIQSNEYSRYDIARIYAVLWAYHYKEIDWLEIQRAIKEAGYGDGEKAFSKIIEYVEKHLRAMGRTGV